MNDNGYHRMRAHAYRMHVTSVTNKKLCCLSFGISPCCRSIRHRTCIYVRTYIWHMPATRYVDAVRLNQSHFITRPEWSRFVLCSVDRFYRAKYVTWHAERLRCPAPLSIIQAGKHIWTKTFIEIDIKEYIYKFIAQNAMYIYLEVEKKSKKWNIIVWSGFRECMRVFMLSDTDDDIVLFDMNGYSIGSNDIIWIVSQRFLFSLWARIYMCYLFRFIVFVRVHSYKYIYIQLHILKWSIWLVIFHIYVCVSTWEIER